MIIKCNLIFLNCLKDKNYQMIDFVLVGDGGNVGAAVVGDGGGPAVVASVGG